MQHIKQQLNHKHPPPNQSITPKQQTILHLLYRFRFLNRLQIQQYLSHTNHKRIILWLNDLTTKNYITRTYSKTFPNNTKPAIYSLALNTIAWLKTQPDIDHNALHKLYREHERSTGFIHHCLLLATLELDLRQQPKTAPKQTLAVQSDYPTLPQATLLTTLKPHGFITKNDGGTAKHYLIELLTDLPELRLKKRIKTYVAFYLSNEWEGATSEAFPTVLFVCPNLPNMIDLKHFTKKLLIAKEATALEVLVTTLEEITTQGIAGEIWEGIL